MVNFTIYDGSIHHASHFLTDKSPTLDGVNLFLVKFPCLIGKVPKKSFPKSPGFAIEACKRSPEFGAVHTCWISFLKTCR